MTEHLEETGIERPSSWSETQDRQLRDLCIVPWNVRDSNNTIFEVLGPDLHSELMSCRVEVADIFTISMKPYYRRLRQAHKHHKPISAFTNDNLHVYLRWFLKDKAGIAVPNGNDFVSLSELPEYVLCSHGFVPHERYPYIVARPSAIILPKAGLGALAGRLGRSALGLVMFISKDKLENAVVFEVTLSDSEREMHEYLEVLSEHYLGEVLDKVSKPYLGAREHGLDIDACDEHQLCNLCSRG
ncbi:hypothetical protein PSENEW3n2_00000626 [Picochlorum sp. SENEW3]|nr:hypothetical protein PSENEW3n2_00000626 [Picochlorum sp. SENEW3]WPT15546.1 hypothetical protein PSENEW3_00000626 [Picochlorum sp. SENEW3]